MMKREVWGTIACLALAFANVAAAQGPDKVYWQGGTNDWASDNWGLNAPVGWPGDGTYTTNHAYLDGNPGQALINDGDWITMGKRIHLVDSTLKQTGGVLIGNSYTYLYDRYDLLGGTYTGNGQVRMYGGGVLYVDGAEFGTRLTASSGTLPQGGGAADLQLNFYDDASFIATATATVDLHTITFENVGAGESALVEFRGVLPAGDYRDRSSLYCKFYTQHADGTGTVKFVFSDEGLWHLTQFSNNGLTLGNGGGTGPRLEVDVSAFTSDGTNAYPLIDYNNTIQGDAKFEATNIIDGIYGSLTLGTLGSLARGEYYLDYAYDSGGGDMNIVLYFNNLPPSAGTAVTIR